MTKLMGDDRNEILRPTGVIYRPRFVIVQVSVSGYSARPRIEGMSQNIACSVERRSITVIAGSKINPGLGVICFGHLSKGQRSDGTPEPEGLNHCGTNLGSGEVPSESIEPVSQCGIGPLSAMRDKCWRNPDGGGSGTPQRNEQKTVDSYKTALRKA